MADDNRLFIDAIRYSAKTGIAGADLPHRFGKPNGLWQRRGVWQRVAVALRDDDTEWLSVDSSCVRVAGAQKSGRHRRAVAEALGRGRGGFGSKIRAAVTPMGHPVALEPTGSQAGTARGCRG